MHSGTFLQHLRKVQFGIFLTQQLISTHHKRQHVLFTRSSDGCITCTHYGCGPQIFQKPWGHL